MLREKQYEWKNWREIVHTTWNPGAEGVVRVHMIPPKFQLLRRTPAIAIINGQEYVPLNEPWAILLTEFVRRINANAQRDISQTQMEEILSDTFAAVQGVYPQADTAELWEDLVTITETFADIAQGRIPEISIGQLSIGEYAPYMTAPHRMDLMVSAMEKDGRWNCNQHCIHCYAAGQQLSAGQELDTEQWKELIHKCWAAKIPQLTFTGGEPTLREDLAELIGAARQFVTRLNTNGIRMTPEYCKALCAAELDSVQITFYSAEAVVHNSLVGGEHYEQTAAGIRNAVAAGLSVSVNTPLCTLNTDYLHTLEFLYEQGIRYVTCSGLIVTGNAVLEQSRKTQLTEEELYQVLEQAVAFCHTHRMEINFTSPGWLSEEQLERLELNVPSCGACLSNMAVTPDGTVVACQSALGGSGFGNLLKQDFAAIWKNRQCRKQRAFAAKMKQVCPLRQSIR